MASTQASRKVVKKAEQLRISNIGDIKARLGGIFELPSGIVVRLRNPGGLKAFMGAGTLPNGLLKIIQDQLSENKGEKPQSNAEKVAALTKDPANLEAMMNLLDTIAQKTIVEPPVYPTPPEGEAMDPEKLYPADFDDVDKQFIFQWIQGGTSDLATFRERLEKNVAAVSAVEGSKDSPE